VLLIADADPVALAPCHHLSLATLPDFACPCRRPTAANTVGRSSIHRQVAAESAAEELTTPCAATSGSRVGLCFAGIREQRQRGLVEAVHARPITLPIRMSPFRDRKRRQQTGGITLLAPCLRFSTRLLRQASNGHGVGVSLPRANLDAGALVSCVWVRDVKVAPPSDCP